MKDRGARTKRYDDAIVAEMEALADAEEARGEGEAADTLRRWAEREETR